VPEPAYERSCKLAFIGASRLLAAFGSSLERGVHLLEADLGLVERALEGRDEDAGEALA
jgi:hypothetical protein